MYFLIKKNIIYDSLILKKKENFFLCLINLQVNVCEKQFSFLPLLFANDIDFICCSFRYVGVRKVRRRNNYFIRLFFFSFRITSFRFIQDGSLNYLFFFNSSSIQQKIAQYSSFFSFKDTPLKIKLMTCSICLFN